jgi:hypothetical protein
MRSSIAENTTARAVAVVVTTVSLRVDLADGRSISVPLGWYPRLEAGSPAERRRWRLVEGGRGIHWPDLDEDVSVEGLVAGRRSQERPASLARWLASRARGSGERPAPRETLRGAARSEKPGTTR